MHAMTEVSQGVKTTRCGLKVKAHLATGWESDVTCEDCGIKKKKIVHSDCDEPSKKDKVSTQSRHIDRQQGDKSMPRATTLQLDKDFIEEVLKLRDTDEKKWDEIAEITGVASGKCMLAYAAGTLPKKELIKNATAADVVRLRDEQNLSWGQISVRCQLPESTCRAMYTDESGASTKGLRIGKGGRHPGNIEGIKRPPSKKTTGKATAAPVVGPLDGVPEEEVAEMLTGYAIKVNDGNGNITPMKVKSVKKVANGKAVLVDGDGGGSRTIKLASITQISKRKVL